MRDIKQQALEGFKMLDLTRLLPGGYCSMLLADMGMEVIKIEDPFKGDYFRKMKPINKKEGAYFLGINRNKKSMRLNLKTHEGKEIFYELTKKCDVVLEGFRPGVVDKLGIGYETIRNINERIIYCSISGYGQNGPYKKRSGHDINYIALSGLLALCGNENTQPIIPPVPIADIGVGGIMSAFAILVALVARVKTGKGQYIDVSMTDGIVSWLCMHISKFSIDGKPPKRGEYEMGGAWPCYNVYETLDSKFISIGIIEPKFWENFCKAIGREDLIPKQFAEGIERQLLFKEIQDIIKTRTRKEWEMFLKDIDCCVEPVLGIEEMFEHPHFVNRKIFTEIEHPIEGRIKQIEFPIKFSVTPGRIRTPPPLPGEHTESILLSIGYSKEKIDKLKEKKVI